jgi:hypothetical protein
MHNKETQAARSNQNESPEGIQRLELLMLRFSEAEIQSLSLLQLVHRQRPNALDQPLEECRLRFARWLVDNGRLSEHTECPLEGQKGQSEARETAETSSCPGDAPAPHDECLPASDCTSEPTRESAQRNRPAEWRLILLRAWSRIRQGVARMADSRRELGQLDYLPGEGGPGDPWSTYDPYGPRGPYSSMGSVPNDPWLWMRFRHGG